MGRYKKRKLVYFGVDYVKAFIGVGEQNPLFKLSVNSNSQYFKFAGYNLYIQKINITDKYEFFYSIHFENISLGFIGIKNEHGNSFIEITGQALTIFGIDIYYYLMKKFNLEFIKYKRIDICFDLELDLNYFYNNILLEKFKENKENLTHFKSKRNGIETLYLGTKNIKKNNYILNRIYNKILDSDVKEKMFLYADKYKNDDGTLKQITRFETELREDLCKFYKFEDLKNKDFLYFRIVKSFYKYNTQFFKFLKDKDFFDFQKEYNLKKKYTLANILSGGEEAPKTAYQERIKKILSEKEMQIKYGKDFIDEKAKDYALKMLILYSKKLYKAGFSYEKLTEIIKNQLNF